MRIITSILLILLTINCYATTPKIYVLYINGVNVDPIEAEYNKNQLKGYVNIKSNMVEWEILYNSTHGLLAHDLYDVMSQKRQEGRNLGIDDYVKTYMKSYKLSYKANSIEYNKLKDHIKEYYKEDSSFVGRNLNQIVNQFHTIVQDNRNSYILLVAHSQGNLYANQLYDYVVNGEGFPKDHIAIFGIANPADKINGDVDLPKNVTQNKYVTGDNDYVIKSLSIFTNFLPITNRPMNSNTTIERCIDKLCHGLITSYLADDETQKQIIEKISYFLFSLKDNLMSDDNTRFAIKMSSDGVAVNSHSELISSNNKVICTFTYHTGFQCDENIMSYLKSSNDMINDYDINRDKYIGFKDKTISGTYRYLVKFSDDYIKFIMNIEGNLQSAIWYEIDDESSCNAIKENDIKSPIEQSSLQSAYYITRSSNFYCAHKFTQLKYNDKYVGGIVTIN